MDPSLSLVTCLQLCNILEALIFLHILLFASEICQSLFTREKFIDIFKLETFRLGEEEVDDRDPGRVQDGEDDVCSPTNVANRRRCDLNDDL